MLRLFVVASTLVCALASTKWYAEYNLDRAEQLARTEQGCFRGQYLPALSLTTCQTPTSTFIAELQDDAFLCVVELREEKLMASAKTIVSDMAKEITPLFIGPGHIVIKNALNQSEQPDACTSGAFDSVADTVMRVPVKAIVPQQPMPINHPAVKRALLHNGTGFDPDPIITELIGSYSRDDVEHYINWVSTDRQGASERITRNSYSTRTGKGGCADDNWRCAFHVVNELEAEINLIMENYPYEWEVDQVNFRNDMCNNVVVKIEGTINQDEVVIIGAHLDSRNTGSGSTASGAAPGADDNGSGTAVQLAILKNMVANPYPFTYSVHLMWFCGEEQGLLGSAALAQSYRAEGTRVIGMFNNDMIGYTDPTRGMTLSFMKRNSEAWLSQSCKEFANTYVPELAVDDTNACCSDQQSWYNAGFPAAGIFETPTNAVVYPQYHKSGDKFDNGLINMEQVYRFGQANYCCILEYAIPIDSRK